MFRTRQKYCHLHPNPLKYVVSSGSVQFHYILESDLRVKRSITPSICDLACYPIGNIRSESDHNISIPKLPFINQIQWQFNIRKPGGS